MKRALSRTRHLLSPQVYVPPMKRWRQLGPLVATSCWVLMLGGFAAFLLTLRGGF